MGSLTDRRYSSLSTRINSFIIGESSECVSLLIEELRSSLRDGELSNTGYQHLMSQLDGFFPFI